MKPVLLLFLFEFIGLSQQSYDFFAGPPSPPTVVTAVAQSPYGMATFCYWVVGVFAIGKSTPSIASCVANANTASSVLVSWSPVSGATNYDVLRTTSPTLPSGLNNIAVATAVSGTTQTDSFGTLTAYTIGSAPAARGTIYLDNKNSALPGFYQSINGQAGALINPNAVASNSANTYTGGGAQNFGSSNLLTTGTVSVGNPLIGGTPGALAVQQPAGFTTRGLFVEAASGTVSDANPCIAEFFSPNVSGNTVLCMRQDGGLIIPQYINVGPNRASPANMVAINTDLGTGGVVLYIADNPGFTQDFIAMRNESGTPTYKFRFANSGLFAFGNEDTSAPALIPNGTKLRVVLGDNSALTELDAGPISTGTFTVASPPSSPTAGMIVFFSDGKNSVDDASTVGSIVVTGGHGVHGGYANGSWRTLY